jgi:hypothetical protein
MGSQVPLGLTWTATATDEEMVRMRRVKATAAAAGALLPILLRMATPGATSEDGLGVVAAVSAGEGSACALYRTAGDTISIELLVANPAGITVRARAPRRACSDCAPRVQGRAGGRGRGCLFVWGGVGRDVLPCAFACALRVSVRANGRVLSAHVCERAPRAARGRRARRGAHPAARAHGLACAPWI